MKTLLQTSALLFGLLVGITAISALEAGDNFGTDEFWTEIGQTGN